MRFTYFGTPDFSCRVLDALEAHGFLPALVITAPDKPRGRGLQMQPSPVKEWALDREIDVLQPLTLKDAEIQAELKNTRLAGGQADWDVFIVAAYAKLLPQAVLNIPQKGCLNVHPSLLPKFRGPSPVISAILADEPARPDDSGLRQNDSIGLGSGGRETGVTIMQMTAEMDAGPIVAQARIEISEEDWPPPASVLTDLLFSEGGNLLAETLPLWTQDKIKAEPQDESKATFSKKFSDEDAKIDLSPAANKREQFLKIRAFDRNPRAYFFAEKNAIKSRIIVTDAEWTGTDFEIIKVIPEGEKEISYKGFLTSFECRRRD